MKCDQYGDSRTERQTAGGRRQAAEQRSRSRSVFSPRFPNFFREHSKDPALYNKSNSQDVLTLYQEKHPQKYHSYFS